ncbi:hypothetical protein SPBR_03904 [Sporothrix brasiliensis 5110]|uniref:Zn(2)-C6 fungal-type domain-containing protein n=1 Tax=Sporothrix brasiliensis 5110 TaxID=1398154 RepID=A0A0C2J1Y7_9PEZI|nr:uncharacterized protein SPBR_03904 [Sporothrix brasiliensis 5110]KIH95331.1 hypothetical protein SPBR_03904 [Sporothrix brasiliensis 5110]
MQPIGKRARQACIACNARRVKCTVTESMPCRNCLVDGQRCEVRESRRGKHPRKRTAASKTASKTTSITMSTSAPSTHGDEVAASEALVTLLRDHDSKRDHDYKHTDAEPHHISIAPATPVTMPAARHGATNTEADADAETSSVFLGESNTLRYVQADAADNCAVTPPDSTSPSSTTAHLLHQVPQADAHDVESKAMLMMQGGDRNGGRLSDGCRSGGNGKPIWAAERRRIQMQFLQTAGALTVPPAATVDRLLDAYFRWFHPCYAVVDEADTRQKQKAGTLSPLLLQAMLFIGAIHAGGGGGTTEDDDDDNGHNTTQRQKYIYYNRCKDLYDADYERDKVTVIQAVFLMSFWRTGPFLEKDTRHWLATAISLAQSKAMHRSTVRVASVVATPGTTSSANAGTSTTTTTAGAPARQLRQLKQRLWWSIYTREQQCAAALGLPSRIRDEDCDVAMLEAHDFEFAFAGAVHHDGIAFQVGATGLARILGTIIRQGYAPGQALTAACKATLRKELRAWKPPPLDAHSPFLECAEEFSETCSEDAAGSSATPSTFYTRLLHLSYNNLLILIYRPAYISQSASHAAEGECRIALHAASRNSRIVEDLVAVPSLLACLRHAPVHTITNLFNTLCMHTIHLRRLAAQSRPGQPGATGAAAGRSYGTSSGTAAGGVLTIAEHRAKVCLLGLQELQRTWDVRNWILELFFRYLDRSTAARLSVGAGTFPGTNTNTSMAVGDHTVRAATMTATSPAPDSDRAGVVSGTASGPWPAMSLNNPADQLSFFACIDGNDCNERPSLACADPSPMSGSDLLSRTPWAEAVPTLEEQQIYLFSQMETDHLTLGEGGGLCGYWGSLDNTSLALASNVGVDSTTDVLGTV